jgi:hypothetical protein
MTETTTGDRLVDSILAWLAGLNRHPSRTPRGDTLDVRLLRSKRNLAC